MLAAPIATLVGVASVGCGASNRFDAERTRWNEADIDSYVMMVTIGGSGETFGPITITVEDGEPLRTESDDPRWSGPELTVDRLFDELEAAETVDAVEFDPQAGYPLRAMLDPDGDKVDDEWSVEVLSLTAAES